METNCKEVVNLWDSRAGSLAIIEPIFFKGLAASFISFGIQHVIMMANIPAHVCAKHACTLTVTSCWFDTPPSFVLTSLLFDGASDF
jgi:hypothetical protein